MNETANFKGKLVSINIDLKRCNVVDFGQF